MMLRFSIILILLIMLAGCPPQNRVIGTLPPPVVPLVNKPQPSKLTEKPPKVTNRSIRGKVVVMDAGHGGHDDGAWEHTKSKLPEKTIVLDIAQKVGRMLSDRGAKVSYTRTTDRFISLEDRALSAERNRADLFVSVHANASTRNPHASGVDIYIYDKASSQSVRAALKIDRAVKQAGFESRGVKRANFHVLREHTRPAVLIECGFLTNNGDAGKLNSSSYRAEIASAIADGIVDYFTH